MEAIRGWPAHLHRDLFPAEPVLAEHGRDRCPEAVADYAPLRVVEGVAQQGLQVEPEQGSVVAQPIRPSEGGEAGLEVRAPQPLVLQERAQGTKEKVRLGETLYSSCELSRPVLLW